MYQEISGEICYRDQENKKERSLLTLRHSVEQRGEASLEASFQKIKMGVGHKEMRKVCVGHFGVKESEKQCLMSRQWDHKNDNLW